MDKLKHILNYLFNPNYVSPKRKDDKVKYLTQFKKLYDDMSTAEKIMSMSLYNIEYRQLDILRNLGALEATLIMLDEVKPGIPIPENELYKSWMLRITKEYLTKIGCYEENKAD